MCLFFFFSLYIRFVEELIVELKEQGYIIDLNSLSQRVWRLYLPSQFVSFLFILLGLAFRSKVQLAEPEPNLDSFVVIDLVEKGK